MILRVLTGIFAVVFLPLGVVFLAVGFLPVGAPLAVVGAGLAIWFLVLWRKEAARRARRRAGLRAKAEVVSAEVNWNVRVNGRPALELALRIGGETVKGTFLYDHRYGSLAAGDRLEVAYDPAEPSNFEPVGGVVETAATAHLEQVALIVHDYDEAIRFFVDALAFELVEDSPSLTDDGRPKRWVVVRPPGAQTGLLLAKADGDAQAAAVGAQFAGRVGLFLRVDDFDAARDRMLAAGVEFVSEPRSEPYGRVAVFRDVAGNRWDLLG